MGGENVYPAEVEGALAEHPGVAAACVYGQPHPLLGETVAAAVLLKPGASMASSPPPPSSSSPPTGWGAELRAWCSARLAPFKVPSSFVFPSSFPSTPSGKVLKRELQASHASQPRSPPPTVLPSPPTRISLHSPPPSLLRLRLPGLSILLAPSDPVQAGLAVAAIEQLSSRSPFSSSAPRLAVAAIRQLGPTLSSGDAAGASATGGFALSLTAAPAETPPPPPPLSPAPPTLSLTPAPSVAYLSTLRAAVISAVRAGLGDGSGGGGGAAAGAVSAPLDESSPLMAMGLTSMGAVAVASRLEEALGAASCVPPQPFPPSLPFLVLL